MKHIFNSCALLLLAAAAIVLPSCNNEVDDIFDDSAATRTTKAADQYKEILEDQGGKWQMEYFTTTDEPGYIYLMTFKKDGSVTISGDNKYIAKLTNIDATAPAFGSGTSMWQVLSDNGPVLSFNTYNRYFHLFSNPEDIPDTETNEQGYGHTGDYEFDLMKYSNDTLYVEGKKHGVKMIMTRVPQGTDDQTYLGNVVALADSFFNAKIPTVYMYMPNNSRFVILNGSTLLPSMYPQYGDHVSMTETYNCIITNAGLRFMQAERIPLYPAHLDLMQEPYVSDTAALHSTIEGYSTVQTFVRQSDGSLLCREDGQTRIAADTLNKVIQDPQMKWRVNATASSGAFTALYNALNAELKAANRQNALNEVNLYFDRASARFVLNFRARVRVGGRNTTASGTLYGDISRDGENGVGFNFDGTGDNMGSQFLGRYTNLKAMLDQLNAHKYSISANSLLAPTVLTLVNQDDASDVIQLEVQ